MNQDILNLYKKAQNGGLNAQEVFWLEGQAAAHPCFGMAYMILARHHYRNQSTIKNRALLKAAAYTNSRSLLRNYLEDTLTPPKSRPIPVAEMKPILEKKALENANSTQEPVSTPVASGASTQPETPTVDASTDAPLEAAAIVAEQDVVELAVENVLVAETQVEEVNELVAETKVEEVNELVAETQVEEVNELVAETQVEEVNELVAETQVEEAPTQVAFAGKPGEINWFLNMRLRLRADKHKRTATRISESIARHAPQIAALATPVDAVVETTTAQTQPPTKVPANEIAATPAPESTPIVHQEPPLQASLPVVETQPIDTEETTTVSNDASLLSAPLPVVEATGNDSPPANHPSMVADLPRDEDASASLQAASDRNNHLPTSLSESTLPVAEAQSPAQDAAAASNIGSDAPHHRLTILDKGKEKTPATKPEKQYEIGAFSSFTFLSEGGNEEVEEVMDIDIATLDAVEFKTVEGELGGSEIVFEENDRIVEISVSQEALDKYFKGRLPSEPLHAFGEFRIELDEALYQDALHHDAVEPTEIKEITATGLPVAAAEQAGLHFELIDREDDTPAALHKGNIDAIIDRFIENEPGITRAKVSGIPVGDLSKDSNKPVDDDWVTETLAKIYEKQGNKGKAIKIYERLRLRFPEKNDYFVSLIQNLKH